MSIVQELKTQLPSSTRSRCAWRSPAMRAGDRLLLALNGRLRLGHLPCLTTGLILGKAPPWTTSCIQTLNLTFVQTHSFDLRLALNYRFARDTQHPEQGSRPAASLTQHTAVLKNSETAPGAWATSPAMSFSATLDRSLPALDPPRTKGVEQKHHASFNSTTAPNSTSISRPPEMTTLRLAYRNEPSSAQQSLPKAAALATPFQAMVSAQHPGDTWPAAWPGATSTGAPPSLVDSLFDSAMQRRPLPGFDVQLLPPNASINRQIAAATETARPQQQPGPSQSHPQHEQWTRNDLTQLADQVDRLLRQRQRFERERRGNV